MGMSHFGILRIPKSIKQRARYDSRMIGYQMGEASVLRAVPHGEIKI